MKPENYYAILGVRHDADEVVIAAAHRALARKYHPDTSGSNSDISLRQFRLVQEAFATLKDNQKRKKYDEKLASTRSRVNTSASDVKAETPNNKTEPKQKKAENTPANEKSGAKSVQQSLNRWKRYAQWATVTFAFCATAVVASNLFFFNPVVAPPEVLVRKIKSSHSCKAYYEHIVGEDKVVSDYNGSTISCAERRRIAQDSFGDETQQINSVGKNDSSPFTPQAQNLGEHKTEFGTPELRKAAHILISVDAKASAPERTNWRASGRPT